MPFKQKGKQKSHEERPRKSMVDKARRLKVWKGRLTALGMPEAEVSKLSYLKARTLLKRPKQVAKKYAAK